MRWFWVALAPIAVAGVVVAVLVATRSDGKDGAAAARSAGPLHAGAVHRAVEVEGREGGEGEREGARTPNAEQVANRAYPRNYVDDRRALAVRRAFERVPGRTPRSAFRTQGDFQRADAVTPTAWTNLGPVTPNVAGEASQFFNPDTLRGPTTQESGRVTAEAIDPACHAGDCRMWVAAAGGGIWRTNDALAAHPAWIAPPTDLPTNAFGSLFYDAAQNTLYAGSGEPNGSGDSEAGLGLSSRPTPAPRGRSSRAARRSRSTARSARSRSTRPIRTRSTSAPPWPATARPRSTAAAAPRRALPRSASTSRRTGARRSRA